MVSNVEILVNRIGFHLKQTYKKILTSKCYKFKIKYDKVYIKWIIYLKRDRSTQKMGIEIGSNRIKSNVRQMSMSVNGTNLKHKLST